MTDVDNEFNLRWLWADWLAKGERWEPEKRWWVSNESSLRPGEQLELLDDIWSSECIVDCTEFSLLEKNVFQKFISQTEWSVSGNECDVVTLMDGKGEFKRRKNLVEKHEKMFQLKFEKWIWLMCPKMNGF